ncbi:hypothetical protein SAMN05444161_8739 [Rhizobiales bacterium GAS191]|nr:hypothetical protein SAMN05519103_06458 [Rhizobiales bacterium GAS113]SEF12322.1 hypothetical protein SAMN05444161_8739 [Rhizobiales bacterium GAS191]
MHGTFPKRVPDRSESAGGGIWTSLAFAGMPLVLAIVVAVFHCGSNATIGNILGVLAAAESASLCVLLA